MNTFVPDANCPTQWPDPEAWQALIQAADYGVPPPKAPNGLNRKARRAWASQQRRAK